MMFSTDLGVKFLISGVNLELWPLKGQNSCFGHVLATKWPFIPELDQISKI